jgi:hypothetical protein
MASVSGILMVKVVPCPATLLRSMVPPIFSKMGILAPRPEAF